VQAMPSPGENQNRPLAKNHSNDLCCSDCGTETDVISLQHLRTASSLYGRVDLIPRISQFIAEASTFHLDQPRVYTRLFEPLSPATCGQELSPCSPVSFFSLIHNCESLSHDCLFF
jgi:hypothetical protein